jgi:hypothetical protein
VVTQPISAYVSLCNRTGISEKSIMFAPESLREGLTSALARSLSRAVQPDRS